MRLLQQQPIKLLYVEQSDALAARPAHEQASPDQGGRGACADERSQGVRACRKSPRGFLRPPFSGTFMTVPSSIFSRACCTPSPLTSRVMLMFSLFFTILSTCAQRGAPENTPRQRDVMFLLFLDQIVRLKQCGRLQAHPPHYLTCAGQARLEVQVFRVQRCPGVV